MTEKAKRYTFRLTEEQAGWLELAADVDRTATGYLRRWSKCDDSLGWAEVRLASTGQYVSDWLRATDEQIENPQEEVQG